MLVKRGLAIAAIMLLVWGLMILLFVAIEKLVVPSKPPLLPSAPVASAIIKLLASGLLASAWLYLWNLLIKLYSRKALSKR